MKKNSNLFISSAIIALTFSALQNTSGMEAPMEAWKPAASTSGRLHSEPGTSNILNQEIMNPKYVHSAGIQDQEKLAERTVRLNNIAIADVLNYHLPLSLIAGAATYLKEGMKFTIQHPKQMVVLGLLGLTHAAEAKLSEVEVVGACAFVAIGVAFCVKWRIA